MGTEIPPETAAAVRRPLTAYEALVRGLSDRLVEAQRPIRILDAIKWDDGVERAFFAAGCRELPPVTADYYAGRPLPFNPDQKRQEFHAIDPDIRRRLGKYNPAGQILERLCEEYREVIDLLVQRGTRTFSVIAERLYGSASDSFHAGDPSLADLGHMMSSILDNLSHETIFGHEEPALDAAEAVRLLAERLGAYFGES